ncbi:MAG: hypothetical protein K1X33_01180 [Methanobacteriaceae archaeon]|nr:hypothetical protein [Methanobacteriaceae archaeon]
MERIRLKLKKLQSRDIIKENNEKNSKEGENLLTKENLDNIDTELPIIKKSNELLDKSSNRSFLITIVCIIIGILFIIVGLYLFGTSSDKVVDNVLSGETATSSVFLIIIGFIIIAISGFISLSSKTSMGKTFDDIKDFEDSNYVGPKTEDNSDESSNEKSNTLSDIESVIKSDFSNYKNNLNSKKGKTNKNIKKNFKSVINSDKLKSSVNTTLDSFKNKEDDSGSEKVKVDIKDNNDEKSPISFDEALDSVNNLVNESKENNENK